MRDAITARLRDCVSGCPVPVFVAKGRTDRAQVLRGLDRLRALPPTRDDMNDLYETIGGLSDVILPAIAPVLSADLVAAIRTRGGGWAMP